MNRSKYQDYAWAYLMILPLVIGLGTFYIYPVIRVFYDSLHEVGAFNRRAFIGLENYVNMFKDGAMWRSLGNTFLYVLIVVPLTITISTILAALLNTNIKGKGFFRTVYFIPTITMSAAIAMVWKWMYNGDMGIFNTLLNGLGFESVRFLTDSNTALVSIAVVSIWMSIGYNMIILLAGIQGISKSYYEAASIDGATGIKSFIYLTLPLLSSTLFFVVVTSLIGTFQTFDIIYMMIGRSGIAMDSAQSMVIYFYRNAFDFSKKGYASGLAVLLFAIIMIITFIQMRAQKKWVNYD